MADVRIILTIDVPDTLTDEQIMDRIFDLFDSPDLEFHAVLKLRSMQLDHPGKAGSAILNRTIGR